MAEAEEALKMLANTKRELKEDLTVKVIDDTIDDIRQGDHLEARRVAVRGRPKAR